MIHSISNLSHSHNLADEAVSESESDSESDTTSVDKGGRNDRPRESL